MLVLLLCFGKMLYVELSLDGKEDKSKRKTMMQPIRFTSILITKLLKFVFKYTWCATCLSNLVEKGKGENIK